MTVAVLCIAVAVDYLTGRRLIEMTAFHQPRAALIGIGRLIECTGLLIIGLVLFALSPARRTSETTALLGSGACADREREIVVSHLEIYCELKSAMLACLGCIGRSACLRRD